MKTKKEKIFDAVFDTIYEEGNIANIRVSDIAKRAGIGKGTVYMYFASKEQMIFEASKYLIESTMKSITDFAPENMSFSEALKNFIRKHIEVTRKYSSLFNATSTTDYFPQLNNQFKEMMADIMKKIRVEYKEALERYIALGAKEKIISKDHSEFTILAVAQMLFSTSGNFSQRQLPTITDDVDKYVDMQYNMAVKMLK